MILKSPNKAQFIFISFLPKYYCWKCYIIINRRSGFYRVSMVVIFCHIETPMTAQILPLCSCFRTALQPDGQKRAGASVVEYPGFLLSHFFLECGIWSLGCDVRVR